MVENLIPANAVQAIKDSEKTFTLPVASGEFTSRPVYLPPADPTVETLVVHTLDSLAEYFQEDLEAVSENGGIVHVVDPWTVNIFTAFEGRHNERNVYLRAEAEKPKFRFDQFLDCEAMVIGLQTQFADSEGRAALQKVAGNIKEATVKSADDDGVSQTVIGKVGITLGETIPVPNPVLLAPFRTFREVEQPASLFIVRARPGRPDSLPELALYEADGGAWKLDAVKNIAGYLRGKLPSATVLA